MLAKSTLIERVQELHQQHKPLNISAVKRRYPQLMEAAYKLTPFYGWKQLLTEAGINYSQIKVELLETITCPECGGEYKHLGNHLAYKHKINIQEYLYDYPGAQLISEVLTAKKSFKGSKNKKEVFTYSHWEPLWTKEYLLDRVYELHRRGFVTTLTSICEIDEAMGTKALRYYGSWSTVLDLLGISEAESQKGQTFYQTIGLSKTPDNTKLISGKYPSRQSVIDGINKRKQENKLLTAQELTKGSTMDRALYYAARKLFPSWKNALKASGLSELDIFEILTVNIRKYKNKDEVIKQLRARASANKTLNSNEVIHSTLADRDSGLYSATQRYFGGWKQALIASGLGHRISTPQRLIYPTKESLIKRVKDYYLVGNQLLVEEFKHSKEPRKRAMYGRSVTLFGGWRQLLASALTTEEIRKIRSTAKAKYYQLDVTEK